MIKEKRAVYDYSADMRKNKWSSVITEHVKSKNWFVEYKDWFYN